MRNRSSTSGVGFSIRGSASSVSCHDACASACAVIGASATSLNTPGRSSSTRATAASSSGYGNACRGERTGAANCSTICPAVTMLVLATAPARANACNTSRPAA